MAIDWLHFSPWSALAGGALIGLVAVATGLFSFCPAYRLLGTAPARSSSNTQRPGRRCRAGQVACSPA